MATMKEIAEKAGVSTATVSHVVNGTKQLTPATTKRVQEVMRELGYRPKKSFLAQHPLRCKVIGVLVEDMCCFPVPDILCGISEALEPFGYHVLLHNMHLYDILYNQYEMIGAYREQVNQEVGVLLNAKVEGIIYVAIHDRHLDGLLDPVSCPVTYAYSLGASRDFFVTYGNKESATEIARCLIARGHHRIAIIAGHPHSFPTMKRLSGFQIALQEAGLTIPDGFLAYGNWEYESGYKKTMDLLKLPELPTAVFAMNDAMAAGCLHALLDNGLRVPEDVSLIGFDNREICEYLRPKLTTIELPVREIGRQAGNLVMEQIASQDDEPRSIILPCKLVERDSVAAPTQAGIPESL